MIDDEAIEAEVMAERATLEALEEYGSQIFCDDERKFKAEKKKSSQTEHETMNQIRAWCGEHGILCFRCNVGRVKGEDGRWFSSGLPSGFSDLLLLLKNGRAVFVEVKDAHGKQREDQKAFENAVKGQGFTYAIARSVEDVESAVVEEYARMKRIFF